ncbi:ATP-binding cassette domain-containing protein [Maledivibacter halophilus]|uniref:ABC transporter ATP-binding protein n=1 Tax=Maledivibacter halophilus TaxID=36842 RepID=UPI0009A6E609|nr:ABC transporter ATP-binding protein [Maledivibacter halophilus]
MIHSITRERKITSLIVLHDLNLAARYADNIIVLDGKGGIYAWGKPISVITSKMIHSVYGVYTKVIIDEEGVPVVIPINSINEIAFSRNA